MDDPKKQRYSERSQQLARELADKAVRNLRRAGRTVVKNSQGHYHVLKPGETPESVEGVNPTQRLAQKLTEKAVRNLRRAGRTVVKDADGRYRVLGRNERLN